MTVPKFLDVYLSNDASGVLKTGKKFEFADIISISFKLTVCAVFEPWGRGGDFLLVILALSVVANNSTSCLFFSMR